MLLPAGGSPSVSGVVAGASELNFLNSIVLPLPFGIGFF
jgi:hypothetical protein